MPTTVIISRANAFDKEMGVLHGNPALCADVTPHSAGAWDAAPNAVAPDGNSVAEWLCTISTDAATGIEVKVTKDLQLPDAAPGVPVQIGPPPTGGKETYTLILKGVDTNVYVRLQA